METIYKYVLLIAIACSKPSIYSTTKINQTVEGDLKGSWNISFNFYAKSLRGVLLYCIDSEGFQFGIKVLPGNNVEINYIGLKNYKTSLLLQDFCGCSKCDGRHITVFAELRNKLINVRCNQQQNRSIVGSDYNLNKPYSIPKSLINSTKRVLIVMGNIGWPVKEGEPKVFSYPQQLIGCLESFHLNSKRVLFQGWSSKIQAQCRKLCFNDTCNGGICHERINEDLSCNCKLTNLNGEYCNRSLIEYVKGANKSFENIKSGVEIYLKMSWSQSYQKTYCLMEILRGSWRMMFTVNMSHLMANSVILTPLIDGGINFVNVDINGRHLNMEMRDFHKYMDADDGENTRINIGFSEGKEACEVFEGLYDLEFNKSLKLFKRNSGYFKNKMKMATKNMMIIFGVLSLLGLLMLLLVYKSIRLVKPKKERPTSSADNVNTPVSVYDTLAGVYGKVEDECEYDFITSDQ